MWDQSVQDMNYGDSTSHSVARVTRNRPKGKVPDISLISRQKVNPEASLLFQHHIFSGWLETLTHMHNLSQSLSSLLAHDFYSTALQKSSNELIITSVWSLQGAFASIKNENVRDQRLKLV